MHEFVSFRSRGQTVVLIALVAVALVAFVALAVDGGNAYATRREAQSAADGGAIAGTWVLVDYKGSSPAVDILVKVNEYAQENGVADTNGNPADTINDNVKAYYVYMDGSCVPFGTPVPGDPYSGCWELHAGPNMIPPGARGLHVVTAISHTTFFARAIGVNTIAASARATATFNPDGGILPIAVNEYWLGSQGKCPWDNCGEPYSFVRDPSQLPPFRLVSSSPEVWARNVCSDPLNENTCQGPYEGYGENFGRAFAILGADAKPNYGSQNPRSGVMLDCRYDALDDSGKWWYLGDGGVWSGPNTDCPMNDGEAADRMAAVILAGGYSKIPIPRALHEPPIDYIEDGWGYCWALPHNEDNCFNYPMSGRSAPYDTLQFLNGSKTHFWADTMYDNGRYVEGRFAPGERIVIIAYNSVAGDQWGSPKKADSAVVVGYFGAIIVGYGNDFDRNCGTKCPDVGDWQCYKQKCIKGQPNTVYGMAASDAPLVIDPSRLINEWLPKKITLIRGQMDR